jgi:hypothetical protein
MVWPALMSTDQRFCFSLLPVPDLYMCLMLPWTCSMHCAKVVRCDRYLRRVAGEGAHSTIPCAQLPPSAMLASHPMATFLIVPSC